MTEPVLSALEALVVTSGTVLQTTTSRGSPSRVAAEVDRLNAAVRDAARDMLTPFDQPADFAAALRRHAEPQVPR